MTTSIVICIAAFWLLLVLLRQDRLSLGLPLAYLADLPSDSKEQAKEYIDRNPASIETPLRAKLRADGWPEAPPRWQRRYR